jgi:hypothetical protein
MTLFKIRRLPDAIGRIANLQLLQIPGFGFS